MGNNVGFRRFFFFFAFLYGHFSTFSPSSLQVFSGKVYGKTRPNSCTVSVRSALDFGIELAFNDLLGCDVVQEAPGTFAADVVIQVRHEC